MNKSIFRVAAFLPSVLLISSLVFVNVSPAFAGVFSVTPVRIYMKPKDRAVAVTLVNEGDEPVALQADISAWTQKPDGTDELVFTEDLILSPPIINLGPKAKQVVRLALLRPADASQQLIYRMVVREVPEMQPRRGGLEVPISLALSMPVFITPPVAKYDVSCTISREDVKHLKTTCKNTGTAYSQVREVLVIRNEQTLARMEGGTYVLPGAQKIIDVKADKAVSAGPVQIRVTFDDGKTQSFEAVLP